MRLYRLLLPVLVLATAAIVAVVPGRQGITNAPGVVHVADLPSHLHTKLARFLQFQAITLAKPEPGPLVQLLRRGRQERTIPTSSPPMLGYSYRAFTVFKVPLAGWGEFGKVLYIDDGNSLRMVPLNADYMKLLEAEAGEPVGRGFIFPFWQFYWGWLFVAALIAAFVSWRREEGDKRRDSGIL